MDTQKEARVLAWFSCGAASAVAAKLAIEKYGDKVELLYCDTLKYEHPDNIRFLHDVEQWLGKKIKIMGSKKYTDIFDVFRKTGWLVGPGGARCTTELKKAVRKEYRNEYDINIFGLTSDEHKRIERFEDQNPGVISDWVLLDNKVDKKQCYSVLQAAKITLPAMYFLGYNNNNCIGCVKGGAGYWNKIRVDFPESFDRMAKFEREIGIAINKSYKGDGKRKRVFLDELDPSAGRGVPLPDIECGALCVKPEDQTADDYLSKYTSVI
jgi:PP-loop superfamily ATP-utilizing enzyme